MTILAKILPVFLKGGISAKKGKKPAEGQVFPHFFRIYVTKATQT
jgi:hypothetical protein